MMTAVQLYPYRDLDSRLGNMSDYWSENIVGIGDFPADADVIHNPSMQPIRLVIGCARGWAV